MKAFCLITALALSLSLCACAKETDEEEIAVPILETAEIEYKTCKAEITDISQKYYADGAYACPYGQNVILKASGQIKSIEVESPCSVKKGDLICTLYSDAVEEQLEEEKIRLDQARSTVNTLISNGGNANEIKMAQYDLQIEQLKYDRLERSLDDYNVYAPCDGEFSMFGRHEGELNINSPVYKGQSIGYTSDKSQEFLCATIADNPLNNVNFGTSVILEQGAQSTTGRVTDIIFFENGDYSTYTYVITPDDDSELFDFGDVRVVFDVYSRLDTVVIPNKAVKHISDRTYVNLLVDGVKVEQDIELGIEDNENVEVLSGLSGGEDIILN